MDYKEFADALMMGENHDWWEVINLIDKNASRENQFMTSLIEVRKSQLNTWRTSHPEYKDEEIIWNEIELNGTPVKNVKRVYVNKGVYGFEIVSKVPFTTEAKRVNEHIVRFPIKGPHHSVDVMSICLDYLKKAKEEGKIQDFNHQVSRRGASPSLYFSIRGSIANEYTGRGSLYEFFTYFYDDGTYGIICQKDNEYESLAEWVGLGEDEFKKDFDEAISLDWT